jgi:S1-C subfamily serine protease
MLAAVLVAAVLVAAGCGSTNTTATPPTTTTAPPKPKPTFAQVVARIRTGIVRIEVTTCDGADIGTGFLLSQRLVATVDHVVNGEQRIALKQNGRIVATGTVIGADPARDVALVRTSKPIHGHLFELATRAPELGEDVAAIGFPLGLPLTVTRGSVSGSDRTIPIEGIKRRSLIQTDAAVNPGNSGGPLITDSGTVVGLVDLGTTQANGLAFAVSAHVANALLQAWKAAPQPIAATTCAPTTPPNTQAAGSSAGSNSSSSKIERYNGRDFSILYPKGFIVTAAEQNRGMYYDTTIEDGDYLIRVDESPNGTGNPDAAAAPVLKALRREAGYQEISIDHITFDGHDALRWEFEVPQSGVLLHKVDIFFTGNRGGDWGLLVQAPASEWSQVESALSILQSSFQEN